MRRRTALLVAAVWTATITSAGTGPATAAAPLTCAGMPATIVGTSDADALVGTPGDDVIVGRAGDDTIDGGGGDDVICGDRGADVLTGGAGDDALYGGLDGIHDERVIVRYGDSLDGGDGDDLLDGGRDTRAGLAQPDLVGFTTSPVGVVVDLRAGTATGQGDDVIVADHWVVDGSDHDDVLLGAGGADWLWGEQGDDVLRGRRGADQFAAGPGDDRVSGGRGRDDIWSNELSGSDVVHGGPGPDAIDESDLRGVDRLYGGPGDDDVRNIVSARGELAAGGRGHDTLQAYSERRALRHVPMTCRSFEVRHAEGHC